MVSFSIALWLAATSVVVTAGLSVPSRPLTTTTVTTCDTAGNVQRLSCEQGVISVQTVLYGRLDRETCSEGWSAHLSNINCVQNGSKGVLQARCDGKSSCEVNVNLFRLSDPCYGTYKYLETTYSCVPARISVACESSIAHLQCGEGLVMRVLTADYGRHDGTTCSFQRPAAQLHHTHCTSSATKNKVAKMCDGRSSCSVEVRNSVFGDPCPGTYKYLEVKYVCDYASV